MSDHLHVDQQIIERLAKDGFQGPLWDRLAHELAKYGLRVMQGWIMSGKIFIKLPANRRPSGGHRDGGFPALDKDAAEIIAVEVVGRAIVSFRDKALVNGRWSPEGGASLQTSIIHWCLHHFPNAYRAWIKEHRHHDELIGEEMIVSKVEKRQAEAFGDPASVVISHEQHSELLRGLPTDLLRAAFLLISIDHSMPEIAEQLGVRVKTIENAVFRYRSKQQRRPGQARSNEDEGRQS